VVQEAGGVVSRLSFETRAATHFGTKGATLGMVGFSLALIFLRDLLRQRPSDRQRKAGRSQKGWLRQYADAFRERILESRTGTLPFDI